MSSLGRHTRNIVVVAVNVSGIAIAGESATATVWANLQGEPDGDYPGPCPAGCQLQAAEEGGERGQHMYA